MRRSLVAVALAALALAVAGSAGAAGSVVPKITFKPDGQGWYAVTATPDAPVKVALRYGTDCNFIRATCRTWELVGTKVLPAGQPQRVSWLQASYWGAKATGKEDVLRGGFYRLSFQVPGKPASAIGTAWRLAFGG